MNNAILNRLCGVIALAAAVFALAPSAFPADPAFVGVLALAVEKEGAQRLGITEEVRGQLEELIARREREALGIVLEVKDLPPTEVAKRLAPFVKESERQGLALLTLEQRETLDQLRIARAGMQSLEDPAVVEVIGLSDEQREQVGDLLEKQAADLTRGGENERRITRNLYERRLAQVLTEEQRSAWQKLAGLADGPAGSAPEKATPPEDDGLPEKVVKQPPAPGVLPPAQGSEVRAFPADNPAPGDPSSAPDATPPATTNRPADAGSDVSAGEIAGEPKLRFNFSYHPWEDVLDWFAEQADLSLQIDYPPPGTFNYKDSRSYTPAQAIDVMNRVLLTKGYTLVRTGRLLTLVNLEEEIPPQLVELVNVRELDDRGEFEIVKCLFQLAKWDPEDAAEEISKLVGRGGSVTALPKASQILVTETAGKLREIRTVVEGVENPDAANAEITPIILEHASPEELLVIARPLLGLEDEQNTNDKIQIAVDAYSRRLFVTGERESVQRLQELVPLVDREPTGDEGPPIALEQPQLATYRVTKADPQQVLQVTQTLMAGLPDVRLAIDPVTNKLIALARPSEHRTIVETLKQLEGDAERVEVISLRRMDPQLVILAIEKLFGTSGEDGEGGDGPKVDGDPTAMKLWVRGTESQIEQVRDLVNKLEGTESGGAEGFRGNVRFLPYTGTTADAAVRNAEMIWNTMRPNDIRMVTPSAISSSLRERVPASALEPTDRAGIQSGPGASLPTRGRGPRPGEPRPQRPEGVRGSDRLNLDDARLRQRKRATTNQHSTGDFLFVNQLAPPAETEPASQPQNLSSTAIADEAAVPDARAVAVPSEDVAHDETNLGPEAATPPTPMEDVTDGTGDGSVQDDQETPVPATPDETSSDIVISRTPNGLVIASQDVEALDEFESLVRTMMEGSSIAPQEPTIFWLKYAKADVAAEILNQVITGVSGSGSGSLVGDVASSVLGDVGGGLLGSLLGGSDALIPSGAPSIVPDVRLNALIVQASPGDLVLIERLLPVIDREAGPESVETGGKPRLIPVFYMSATEMADIVKQVYADRIATAGGERQGRQPSPEDFIRALRGGGGGRGGRGTDAQQEVAKMTIGVDERSNSLIVAAPEPLFRDVEELVSQLDQEGLDSDDDVAVVSIRQANPEVLHKALSAIVGESMQSSGTSSSSNSSSSSSQSSSSTPQTGASSNEDAIRRRIEFFRGLQQRGGFGGSGRTPGGFGGGGGRPGGGTQGGGGFGRGGRGGR